MFEDFRINIFLTVCKTGSFTKAAEDVGVSQPAVSQNIAELEKLLNVKLFDRNRRELVLTDDGRAFYEYAEKISYWYKAADSLFCGFPKMKFRESVVIAASDDILPNLSQALSAFMTRNQNIKVSVVRYNEETSWENDYPDGVDLILSSKLLSDEIQWTSGEYDLLDSPLVAFVSSTSSFAFSSLEEALSHSVGPNVICPDYLPLPLSLHSSLRMRTHSTRQIVDLVSSSAGLIGIAPYYAVGEYVKEGSLKILPSPEFSAIMRVRYIPSEVFAKTSLCTILKQKLTAVLLATVK